MTTVEERAERFAENCLGQIKKDIADAYIEGYCMGHYDGVTKRNKKEEEEEDDEFIDLGLPSGTLWRADFLSDEDFTTSRLAYKEARNLDLPTEEQCRELMSKSNLVREKNGITFQGKDNEELYLGFTDQVEHPEGKADPCIRFWVKGDVDADLKAPCLQCSILLLPGAAGYHICRRFVGEKIAVLTVKNKKKSK